MRNIWTNNEIERLRELYPVTPTKQLSKLIGRPVASIHSKAKKLKIKKEPLYTGNQWTIQMDEKLKELYETHTSKEIGAILNISYTNIKNRASKLGLGKKTNSGCFQKGHTPANKGKKMNPEIKKKVAHTFFQKGHKPVNTLYDGAVTTRKDKRTGIVYKYIRIAEGKWDLLHRVNYKKKYGDIPTTTFLRCKDGNQLNCDPDNWEPIDMAKNMALNTIHNYPPDARKAMRLLGKLKRTITKISKDGKE